jgi:signal transduction histidine kinase
MEDQSNSLASHEGGNLGRRSHKLSGSVEVGAGAETLLHGGAPEAEDVRQIEDYIQKAVAETRDLARGIFPVHIDGTGLSVALKDFSRITGQLTGASVQFEDDASLSLDEVETGVGAGTSVVCQVPMASVQGPAA